ncbi:UNVERIFIED_CONTAM: hypothetical protein ABID98_005781 [Brevibacillus sp. OAP136]
MLQFAKYNLHWFVTYDGKNEKNQIQIKATIPVIVSKQLFNTVQALREQKRKTSITTKKKKRILTVSSAFVNNQQLPQIRIQGKWLNDLGFSIRRRVEIKEARLAEIKQEFFAEKIIYEDYKDFKATFEESLIELQSKKLGMALELVGAHNSTYDANEVDFVMEHFETLMENADVQLKKQLLESLIERINLNLTWTRR